MLIFLFLASMTGFIFLVAFYLNAKELEWHHRSVGLSTIFQILAAYFQFLALVSNLHFAFALVLTVLFVGYGYLIYSYKGYEHDENTGHSDEDHDHFSKLANTITGSASTGLIATSKIMVPAAPASSNNTQPVGQPQLSFIGLAKSSLLFIVIFHAQLITLITTMRHKKMFTTPGTNRIYSMLLLLFLVGLPITVSGDFVFSNGGISAIVVFVILIVLGYWYTKTYSMPEDRKFRCLDFFIIPSIDIALRTVIQLTQ